MATMPNGSAERPDFGKARSDAPSDPTTPATAVELALVEDVLAHLGTGAARAERDLDELGTAAAQRLADLVALVSRLLKARRPCGTGL